MEVRKTSVAQNTQIDQKPEVTKVKSSVQNLIPDSFESKNSSAADSNTSSASSEPEKKAGQITGGILIKQMTNARLGGAQSGSKSEDSKNSGLQIPFSPNKGNANPKFSKVDKDQIIAASGQSSNEQTSNAVKDAGRFVDGGTLRSQFDAEVSGRNQDANALGGSDRLSSLVDPTLRGSQQSGHVGKDQLAYEKTTTETYPDGGHTDTTDSKYHDEHGEHEAHTEITYSKDGIVEFYQKSTVYGDNNSVVDKETETFIQYDKDGNQIKDTTTTKTTTTNADGSTKVENATTTTDQNGKKITDSNTTETPAGGGAKSYDQENYTGNIPEAVKKTMDYFKQQAISQKPQSGGETVHTDDSATGGTITGGPVSNLFVQQGSLGLLGNPGSADLQTGLGGGQGPVRSSQSGGNVDFGPDSDQVGYTGVTHEDDPGDVQFGPAEQPKQQTDSKKTEESNDSAFSYLDPLERKRRDK